MFYCDDCARKKGWKISFVKSFGPCEVCHKYRECNDKKLPAPPRPPKFAVDQKDLEYLIHLLEHGTDRICPTGVITSDKSLELYRKLNKIVINPDLRIW